MIIREDNTVVYDNVDNTGAVVQTETGNIVINDDNFSLTAGEFQLSGTWKVSGDRLMLTVSEMNATVVVVATRE